MSRGPAICVDGQSLQSPSSRGRGIGRYVGDLVGALAAMSEAPIHSLLVHPGLGLTAEVQQVIGQEVVLGHTRGAPKGWTGRVPDAYLATTLFDLEVPEATVLPEWLSSGEIVRAGLVFDLIPALFPDEYLADPSTRARYWARLEGVRHLDLALCISEATRQDLIRVLDFPADRAVNVGTGISDQFRPADDPESVLAWVQGHLPEVRAGFLMYTGGIDYRKNMAGMLEAYAQMDRSMRSAHQLVVVCRLLPSERMALETEIEQLGVSDDVVLTGFVADDVLAALYQVTRLFVFPSRYEGFGLPVAEAILSGAPAIASDSSSLREIVVEDELRFDPEDPDAFAALMTRTLGRNDLDDIAENQLRHVSETFTWGRVAQSVCDAVRNVRDPDLDVLRRKGPSRHVAIVGPVPPQRSGIADYSWRLAHALTEWAQVTLVVESGRLAKEAWNSDVLSVVPIDEFFQLDSEVPYSDVIYVMGNSEFHGFVFDAMAHRPGSVLIHEAQFSGFLAWYAQTRALGAEWFKSFVDAEYPRVSSGLGSEGWLTFDQARDFGVFLLGPVLDRASQVMTTSDHTATIAKAIRPGRADSIHSVGFGFPQVDAPDIPAPESEGFVIGTVGLQASIKATDLVIRAFAHLTDRLTGLRLEVVGEIADGFSEDLRRLVERLGVEDGVFFTDWLTPEEYEGRVARLDLAVQLRRATNGEVSAAVSDCLRFGVPTIVTDIGTVRELPEAIVLKVDSEISAAALADEMYGLLSDEGRRQSMATAARTHASSHDFAWAARELADRLGLRR